MPSDKVAYYDYKTKQIIVGPGANTLKTAYEELFHAYDGHINPKETYLGNREALAKLFVYQMEVEAAKVGDEFKTEWMPWTTRCLEQYINDPNNEKADKWLEKVLKDRLYSQTEYPRDLKKINFEAFNNLFDKKINKKTNNPK